MKMYRSLWVLLSLSLAGPLSCSDDREISLPQAPKDQGVESSDMFQTDAPDEPDISDELIVEDMAQDQEEDLGPLELDMSEPVDMAPAVKDPDKPDKEPDPPKPPSSKKTIRVMTYNIKRGSVTSIEKVAAAIKAQDPDLVGLQEVFEGSGSNTRSNAKKLGSLLKMHSVFRYAHSVPGGYMGNAVLSKYPILSVKRVDLSASAKYNRILMIVRVKQPDGTVLTIANTHFGLTSAERSLQMREVRAQLKGRKLLTLTGDFNSWPSSDVHKFLTEELRDTWGEAGSGDGPTSPARAPRNRIDYIYRSRDWKRAEKARVPNTQASDHRPVRVDLVRR